MSRRPGSRALRPFGWSVLISLGGVTLASLVGGLNGLAVSLAAAATYLVPLGISAVAVSSLRGVVNRGTRSATWVLLGAWLFSWALAAVLASAAVGLPFNLSSDLPLIPTWLVSLAPMGVVGLGSAVIIVRSDPPANRGAS